MAAIAASEFVERQAFMGWFNAVSKLDLTGVNWGIVQIGDALCSVSPSEPSPTQVASAAPEADQAEGAHSR